MQTIERKPRNPQRATRHVLAWQGFELRVPDDWNVVKIEGDARQGMVLLADLSSPRLGLRWATPRRSKLSAGELVRNAMRSEVGELAAKLSRRADSPAGTWAANLLFEEPEPPGRDVWVAMSDRSNRLVQLAYQATSRDGLLAKQLLPAFAEQSAGAPQRWSVLDLSCELPPEFALSSHQLAAGDLRLAFEAPSRRRAIVRQIGPAELALSRQPIERWLDTMLAESRKLYRSNGTSSVTIDEGGRKLTGIASTDTRRRRAFLHRALPQELTTLALHDDERNRIVLVQASDESLARSVAKSVGWATRVGCEQ